MKDIIIRPKQWGQCRKGIKKETKKKVHVGVCIMGDKNSSFNIIGYFFLCFLPFGTCECELSIMAKRTEKNANGIGRGFSFILGKTTWGLKRKKGF